MIPITMADVLHWKKQEENQIAADSRWRKDTYHYIHGLFERLCPGHVEEDAAGCCLGGRIRVFVNMEGIVIDSKLHGSVTYDRSPEGDRALQERLLSELASVVDANGKYVG